MSRLDSLLEKYKRSISAPWSTNIAAPQRVIFVVYDPADELRLRARIEEFALVTRAAGHEWRLMDLAKDPAEWIASHEYREAYFENPGDLMRDGEGDVQGYAESLWGRVEEAARAGATADSVFAIHGLGSLFGFAHVSTLIDRTKNAVPGRYVVFFPGDYRDGSYRLLDARDGWNYLALPIIADET